MILSNTSVLLVLLLFLLTSFFVLSTFSHRQELQTLREEFKEVTIADGLNLVTSHAFLLRTYVGDNSFNDIQQNAQITVESNANLIYGGFVRDHDFQPYAWVTPEDPSGVVESMRELRNDTTEWGAAQQGPTYREIEKDGNRFIEFAAPVVVEDEETQNSDRLGTLIYGYSTDSLENKISLTEARFSRQILLNSLVFSLLGFLAIGAGFFLTRRQATKITKPIGTLTDASDRIAAGYYGEKVMVQSGDEIQDLAISFNKMSADLKSTYADLFSKKPTLGTGLGEAGHF